MIDFKNKDLTIAKIVSENYKTADVFKKYDIDFCCGGNKQLSSACTEKNLDLNLLTTELSNALNAPNSNGQNFKSWSISFLIDYIENNHHTYVNQNMPTLLAYSEKVASAHGTTYSEVIEIFELVKSVVAELTTHLKKEELVLFPNAKRLDRAFQEKSDFKAPPFVKFSNPIGVMEHEHDEAGNIFKKIRELSNNYTPPQDACNTYRVLYKKLEEFETDLHQHVHLENNILHPKVLKLEAELI